MNSPLLDKFFNFATKIVLFYEDFSKTKKDTTIAKQLSRSATSESLWIMLLKSCSLLQNK